MTVMLLRYTVEPDLLCGQMAALCTGFTGDPVVAGQGAISRGHESVAEHATFTFVIDEVSRALLAQITRHRMASFSVQSQRYCGVEPVWIVPPKFKELGLDQEYIEDCDRAYAKYCSYIERGAEEEDARYVIPQGVTCRMGVTMNARELRHFFGLRCCNRAQWEIRDLDDYAAALIGVIHREDRRALFAALDVMGSRAIQAACELVQVAAVCRKAIGGIHSVCPAENQAPVR